MTRSETCLKAALRAAAGLAVVVLGQAGGYIAAGLLPIPLLGPLVYSVAAGPTLVIGLYLVATAVWIIVEGATDRSLERRRASPVHGVRATGSGGDATAADDGPRDRPNDAPDDRPDEGFDPGPVGADELPGPEDSSRDDSR